MKRPCTAHRTDGQPCEAQAIRGGNVCRVHGGSAPAVKAAAQRRLLDAADPVAAELVRLGLYAEDPRVRLSPIKDLLDRAGITQAKQVDVLTVSFLEAEIARMEAELGVNDAA